MAALRDELEKRQGALTAVEAANKLRAEADDYAAKTKADVDGLLSDARDKNKQLDTGHAELAILQLAFDTESSKKETDLAKREKEVSIREAAVTSRMAAMDAKDVDLQNRQAKLVSDQVEFDSRVRAYMDRIASLAP